MRKSGAQPPVRTRNRCMTTTRVFTFLGAGALALMFAAQISSLHAADPADPAPAVSLSAEVAINISSGQLAEANRRPSAPADLATKLKTIATVFDNPLVILRADVRTSHLQIAEILRACELAGLTQVRVETGGPVASIR